MQVAAQEQKTMQVTSGTFRDGGSIPRRFTCQGNDASPPLDVGGVPEGAQTLAFVMDDPDAPSGTFTHWLAWNLPASTRTLPEAAPIAELGGREGRNDFGNTGYGGPCPPSGTHRYVFRVFALDTQLKLAGGASKADLEGAMTGRVLAWGELVGTYQKS